MGLRAIILGFVLGTLPFFSSPGESAGLGKAMARGTAKSASRALRRNMSSTLRRDLLRDRRTPAKVLTKDRTVFRYVTRKQAQRELRTGLRPGSHMTSRATPGRPLSPANAQRRYGLPKKPQERETIRLPRGTRVRTNRVVGGARKVETTSPEWLPPQNIKKVVP